MEYVRVKLPANFDMTYIFELKEKLSSFPYDKGYSIVFDFRDTQFLSSLGVGILLYINARARKNGGETILVNVREHIRNTLHLLGADHELSLGDGIPGSWQDRTEEFEGQSTEKDG